MPKIRKDALLTLKPTSVESERIFSNVGRIATKYRMNLNDKNLNALVVLRALLVRLNKECGLT